MNKTVAEFYESIEEEYHKYVDTLVNIDESNLDKALSTHASIYAYVGSVVAYAKKVESDMEVSFEQEYANLKVKAALTLKNEGTRATKDALDRVVDSDPGIIKLKHRVADLEFKFNLCKNLFAALNNGEICSSNCQVTKETN